MRALFVTGRGGWDCLAFGRAKDPAIGAGDLLVQVHAAGVDLADLHVLSGQWGEAVTLADPQILGSDVCGTVLRVGKDVTRFRVGDAVCARLAVDRLGGFAERCVAREHEAATKPLSLTFEEAAGLPYAALTAWQAVVEGEDAVRSGERVLVLPAASGVGSYAVQFAVAAGATVVAAGNACDEGIARALGAHEFIAVAGEDFSRSSLAGATKDAGEKLFNAVFVADERGLKAAFSLTRRGGRVVSFAGPPTHTAQGLAPLSRWKKLRLWMTSGSVRREAAARGVKYAFVLGSPNGEQLARIARLVDAGSVRVLVDRVFPFEEGPNALRHVASGAARGKTILRMPVGWRR